MRPSQFPRLLVSAVPQALTQGAVSFAGQLQHAKGRGHLCDLGGDPRPACIFYEQVASSTARELQSNLVPRWAAYQALNAMKRLSSIFSRVKGGPAIDRRQAE
jgi:hypothetical protein